MKKTTSLLLATTIIGSLSLTALAPTAFASERGHRGENSDRMGQRGGPGGPGGFIHLMCSEKGAERLEAALGKMSEKIDLTSDQQVLLDALKTVALTAQTDFADNCTTPAKDDDADFIDGIKAHQANMAAHLAAMDDVIPAMEAFYDSLTDEQKAELKKGHRGERGGRSGHRGGNGSRNKG